MGGEDSVGFPSLGHLKFVLLPCAFQETFFLVWSSEEMWMVLRTLTEVIIVLIQEDRLS